VTKSSFLLAALFGVACVHIIDPREAANTDAGLQVWVQVSPLTISLRDTVTRLRIRVYAKNPGRDTVFVENGGPPCSTPLDPATGQGLLFSARIVDDNDELHAGPPHDSCGTALVFAPRRQRTRDFFVTMRDWRASYTVVAKEYRVRSYFAGYEGYQAVITVTQ
jgi:hypothetical protein